MTKDCFKCGGRMAEDGFDGNYKVLSCVSCGAEKLSAISGDHGGFSVEDLNHISEFND